MRGHRGRRRSRAIRSRLAAPPRPSPRRTPLERVELDRLRLVGLVLRAGRRARCSRTTAGLGYIAAIGTPVGPRGGVVVAIERGRLRIREPASTDDIVLALRDAAGAAP